MNVLCRKTHLKLTTECLMKYIKTKKTQNTVNSGSKPNNEILNESTIITIIELILKVFCCLFKKNYFRVIKSCYPATGLYIFQVFFKCSSFRPNVSTSAGVSEGGHPNEAVQESHAATDVLSGER